MNIIKRDGANIRPEYVNSFKTYAGNGEIVIEFSRVDLAATLETSTDGTDPKDMVIDVVNRCILRQDQLSQLINTLVGALSQQPAAPQTNKGAN